MSKTDQPPLSPSSQPEPPDPSPSSSTQPTIPPLDSSIRTTPIHPLLPDIRVPGDPLPIHKYNPVTCLPIDFDGDNEDGGKVRAQLEQLRREYTIPAAALKAQEQAAKEAKRKIEEVGKKREEVQRAMDKKTKEWDTELKVLSKFRQVKVSDIPS